MLRSASHCYFHFILLDFQQSILYVSDSFKLSILFPDLNKDIFSRIVYHYSLPLFPGALLIYFSSSLLSFHFFLEVPTFSMSPYFREDTFLELLGFRREVSAHYSFHFWYNSSSIHSLADFICSVSF